MMLYFDIWLDCWFTPYVLQISMKNLRVTLLHIFNMLRINNIQMYYLYTCLEPTLGIGVQMDSWIFIEQLQGLKPIGLRSFLYH
jgi:hypothetical protein